MTECPECGQDEGMIVSIYDCFSHGIPSIIAEAFKITPEEFLSEKYPLSKMKVDPSTKYVMEEYRDFISKSMIDAIRYQYVQREMGLK